MLPEKGVCAENLHINIIMVNNFHLAGFICLLPKKAVCPENEQFHSNQHSFEPSVCQEAEE